jgi:hypothetical protein
MSYKFKSEVWIYPGESANWHFVSLPVHEAREIKAKYGTRSRGWGSLPVRVTIGKTKLDTSIFPDKKSATYILPIKKVVRSKEHINKGDHIKIKIEIKV